MDPAGPHLWTPGDVWRCCLDHVLGCVSMFRIGGLPQVLINTIWFSHEEDGKPPLPGLGVPNGLGRRARGRPGVLGEASFGGTPAPSTCRTTTGKPPRRFRPVPGRNLNDLYFGPPTTQNRAFSHQNKGQNGFQVI